MIEQRTNEWFDLRIGKVTASSIYDICKKTKSGYSAYRKSYMNKKIFETLSGEMFPVYETFAMKEGTRLEPIAKDVYMLENSCLIEDAGFIQHPSIERAGASPDGFIEEDGLIEVKCPQPENFMNILLDREIPEEHIYQMQFQMACTNRMWCDYFVYSSSLKRYSVQIRVDRDNKLIELIENEIKIFLEEMDLKIQEIQKRK